MRGALLALVLAPPALALEGKPPPSPGNVVSSADGMFHWGEGERKVAVYDPRARRERLVRIPLTPGTKRWRVLFAERGRYFCVVEEKDEEVGLHLKARRGAKAAKAHVVAARLRLVDQDGASLWIKDMPEKYAVGPKDDARALKIADDGTMAILLHDVDPYDKARPVLMAVSPRGLTLLKLDYTTWTRIEEFALSPGGRRLAVRGFGSVPAEERWEKAAAVYDLKDKKAVPEVVTLPEAGEEKRLSSVGEDGWACCVRKDGAWTAFHADGRLRPAP